MKFLGERMGETERLAAILRKLFGRGRDSHPAAEMALRYILSIPECQRREHARAFRRWMFDGGENSRRCAITLAKIEAGDDVGDLDVLGLAFTLAMFRE